MELFSVATYLYANSSRTAKPKVEQHEVRFLLFKQPPVGRLSVGCSNNFRLRNISADDAEGALQFKGDILYDDNFEVLHILGNVIIMNVMLSLISARIPQPRRLVASP